MRFIGAAVAYIVVTLMLFGDPLQPIALATRWSNRLGAPYWQWLALLGFVASVVMFRLLRNSIFVGFRPSAFVFLAVLVPTIIVGVYTDALRHSAVLAFGATEVEEHSFYKSVCEAPHDFQLFLHGGAKGLQALRLELSRDGILSVGPVSSGNVIPRRWMTMCSIPESSNAR
jgi:hypothetical protein